MEIKRPNAFGISLGRLATKNKVYYDFVCVIFMDLKLHIIENYINNKFLATIELKINKQN